MKILIYMTILNHTTKLVFQFVPQGLNFINRRCSEA